MGSKAEGEPRPTNEQGAKPEGTAGDLFMDLAGTAMGIRAAALFEEQKAYQKIAETLDSHDPSSAITKARLNRDAEGVQGEIEKLGTFPSELDALLKKHGLQDVIIPSSSKPEASPAPTQPTPPEGEIPDWVKEALEDKGPLMFEGKEIAPGRFYPGTKIFGIVKILTKAAEKTGRKAYRSTLSQIFHGSLKRADAMRRISVDIGYLRKRLEEEEEEGFTIVNGALIDGGGKGQSYYKIVRKPKDDQPVLPEGDGAGPSGPSDPPRAPSAGLIETVAGNGKGGTEGSTVKENGEGVVEGLAAGEKGEGRTDQGDLKGEKEAGEVETVGEIVFPPVGPGRAFLEIIEPPVNGSNGHAAAIEVGLDQGETVVFARETSGQEAASSGEAENSGLSKEEIFLLACAVNSVPGQLILLRQRGKLLSPEARGKIKKIIDRVSKEALLPDEQGARDDLILEVGVKLAFGRNDVIVPNLQQDDRTFLLSIFSGTTNSPEDVFSEIIQKMSLPVERIKETSDDDILALAILLRAKISQPVLRKYDIRLEERDISKINNIADPIVQQRRKMRARDMDKEVIPSFIEKILRLSPSARKEFLDHCPNKARSLFNFLRGLDGEGFGSLMLELYEARLFGQDSQEPVERTVSWHGKGSLPFNAAARG